MLRHYASRSQSHDDIMFILGSPLTESNAMFTAWARVTVLTTILPAVQAAGIYPAEALRYE